MSRWEQPGRVERIPEQEKNTHDGGPFTGIPGKPGPLACCMPVVIAWFLPQHAGLRMAGVRHIGPNCRGRVERIDVGYWLARGRWRAPR